VATRARRVVWAESAQKALDEIIADIATDSDSGAVRVLTVALETAESLSTLAERGRMVPEVGDPTLRELFVFDYRLLYRVYDDTVVIRAFLHGARDFAKWQREESPEL
jgi:plasmid stabilization system protein ParE